MMLVSFMVYVSFVLVLLYPVALTVLFPVHLPVFLGS